MPTTVMRVNQNHLVANVDAVPRKFVPTDYAFGAIGDGVANDTVAYNACIAAAAAATPPGEVYRPPGTSFLVTSVSNLAGVKIEGPGKVIKTTADGIVQLSSDADEGQHIFGTEYLACFWQRILDGLDCCTVVTGDSTIAGAFTVAGYKPDEILTRLAAGFGAQKQTFVNRGVSGANSTTWRTTLLAGDLVAGPGGTQPHHLIVHWGMNDIPDVAAFIASMRTAFTTIRGVATVATLAITLVPPNAGSGTLTGRDEKWTEAIRRPMRQIAREFQCCYIDAGAILLDARATKGVAWNDDVSSGGSVHPLSVWNAAFWTKVAREMYPAGLATLTGPSNTSTPLTLLNGWTLYASDVRHVSMGRSAFATPVTTPDSVANSIVGDLDLRANVALDNYLSGATQTLLNKLHTPGQYSYDFYVGSDGKLYYRWSPDGTAVLFKSSTVVTGLGAGVRKALRAVHDVDNGAAGNDVKFYTSPDGYGPVAGVGTATVAGGAGATTFSVPQAPRVAITATQYVTTPDSAAFTLAGDLDLRVRVALTNYASATTQTLLNKLRTSGQYSFDFYTVNGFLVYRWSANGVAVNTAVSTIATGLAANAIKWLRAVHDVDNGAAGNNVLFYLSDDGVTWTQLGATVTAAGVTSIFDGSDALHLGANAGALPIAGNLFRADIYSGIAGVLKATFNPLVSASDGDTSMVATTGEVWTVSGGASIAVLLHSIITIAGVDYPVASYDGTTAVLTGAPNSAGSAFIHTSWTQLGATVTTAGVTSIFNGTDQVELGGNGGLLPLIGNIYRVDILSGIAGVLKATFNPAASAVDGATSVVATTGETWTLTGGVTVFESRARAVKTTTGVILLSGRIKNGGIVAGTVIATLPAGYRPPDTRRFALPSDTPGSVAQISVNTAGSIAVDYAPSNGSLSLDGIQFLAA